MQAAANGVAASRPLQQRRAPAAQPAPLPPPPPPPPPAADLALATLRRIELSACIMSLLIQALVYRRTHAALTPRGHAHQLCLLTLHIVGTVVLGCLSHRAWLACRVPFVALLRALVVAVPSYRSTTVRVASWGACPRASMRGRTFWLCIRCQQRAALPPPLECQATPPLCLLASR